MVVINSFIQNLNLSTMSKQEILDTITILCSSETVAVSMKQSLLESDIDIEPLGNTTIIAVENTIGGAKMQSCKGIDMAQNMLINDQNCKIILYHVLPVEYLRKNHQKLDIVLAKPNVRLLEMPFSLETLATAFQTKSINIDSSSTQDALNKHIAGELSSIWHDIKKAPDPLHPSDGWQKSCVVSGIAKAKEVFPMLADKDNAFILQFLEETSAKREEVRKGETFSGIFCDMEGTLFSNGTLNNAVLEFLRKHEAEGKEIRLWSDGNLPELQPLLDVNNITYQLNAKRDFAGAIVEMAIDDMDEHSFSAITKVFAKEFKQVGSILT